MNYSIEEFSKITMLTITTLNECDELNILNSNNINQYTKEQVSDARFIKLLKSYNFSVKEISEILENYNENFNIRPFLYNKDIDFELQVKKYDTIEKKVKAFNNFNAFPKIANRTVIEKNIPSMDILSMTFKHKYEYKEIKKYMGRLLRAAGKNAIGKPFCLYHKNENFTLETIEICIEVNSELEKEDSIFKTLPGGNSICLEHIGTYDTIGSSYQIITDYAIKNNIKFSNKTREVLVKSAGKLIKGNPEKYKTEIQFLII